MKTFCKHEFTSKTYYVEGKYHEIRTCSKCDEKWKRFYIFEKKYIGEKWEKIIL